MGVSERFTTFLSNIRLTEFLPVAGARSCDIVIVASPRDMLIADAVIPSPKFAALNRRKLILLSRLSRKSLLKSVHVAARFDLHTSANL